MLGSRFDGRSLCSFKGAHAYLSLFEALILYLLHNFRSQPSSNSTFEKKDHDLLSSGKGKAVYRAISKFRHMNTELQDTFEDSGSNLWCRESLLDVKRRNARRVGYET